MITMARMIFHKNKQLENNVGTQIYNPICSKIDLNLGHNGLIFFLLSLDNIHSGIFYSANKICFFLPNYLGVLYTFLT